MSRAERALVVKREDVTQSIVAGVTRNTEPAF
jgi:hypothetical protein